MPVLITREDAIVPGKYLQAGAPQVPGDAKYLTVGTNSADDGTAWLTPQAAYEFASHLADLAVTQGAEPTPRVSYALLVTGPNDESYDPPEVFGPFETIEEGQRFAEDFREANGLPRPATDDNNDEWTNAGWYFGVHQMSMEATKWA